MSDRDQPSDDSTRRAVRRPVADSDDRRPELEVTVHSEDTVRLSKKKAASDESHWREMDKTQVVENGGLDPEEERALIERRMAAQQLARGKADDDQLANRRFGDFRILRKIGKGAMATVYKAHQISWDRIVALKLLHRNIAETPKLVERFYREARVLGQLDHPNIVQGYEVGEVDGVHYFAMEYVRGTSLQRWLDKLGRLNVGDALHITIRCARALQYAHDNDLIHRDIKPENILITRDRQVKVADLGMVKQMDEDLSLTQTGHAVGTPWYMPLEQAKNAKDVDGRCDIYALGCTLYCMLTGKPPFMGDNIVEVIKKKEIGTFPPARQVNPDVPDRLDIIIAKMTAKDPRHRYSSCAELIADLEALDLANDRLVLMPSVAEDFGSGSDLADDTVRIVPDTWYVQVKVGGKPRTRKYTTAQLRELLQQRRLPPTVQAARSEDGPFRSVATYKEFRSLTLAAATKEGADRQTVRYRNLYRKIEDQEEKRDRSWRGLGDDEPEEEESPEARRRALVITAVVAGGIALLLIILAILQSLLH